MAKSPSMAQGRPPAALFALWIFSQAGNTTGRSTATCLPFVLVIDAGERSFVGLKKAIDS
jgi:hypothetical protein